MSVVRDQLCVVTLVTFVRGSSLGRISECGLWSGNADCADGGIPVECLDGLFEDYHD